MSIFSGEFVFFSGYNVNYAPFSVVTCSNYDQLKKNEFQAESKLSSNFASSSNWLNKTFQAEQVRSNQIFGLIPIGGNKSSISAAKIPVNIVDVSKSGINSALWQNKDLKEGMISTRDGEFLLINTEFNLVSSSTVDEQVILEQTRHRRVYTPIIDAQIGQTFITSSLSSYNDLPDEIMIKMVKINIFESITILTIVPTRFKKTYSFFNQRARR